MDSQGLYINKYLPPAILYFFFNGVLLPLGVLYTTLLTPIFLLWLLRYPSINYLRYFFLFTVPLFFIHLVNGIEDYRYYVQSYISFFSVYVFGLAFYQYLENCHSLRHIFKKILIFNGIMTVIALICLFIPPLKMIFWYRNNMSLGQLTMLRLQMLTYEPSYYSQLLAPIVFYYLLKLFRRELPNPLLYYSLVLIPLILSFSFGVIIDIGMVLGIQLVINSRQTIFKGRNLLYLLAGLLLLGGVFTYMQIFNPNNVIFLRMANVLSGRDLSANGRTTDSFILGWDIARKRSLLFGVGFGQVKVLGLEVFKTFYNYTKFTVHDIGIPNAVGDTFATLGFVGAGLKLFLECYFFFKTKVWTNHYRLALFLFVFIYQFTGSFLTNIAEYAIWILAFKKDLFPEFNKIKAEAS
jgi:hypothetical protein